MDEKDHPQMKYAPLVQQPGLAPPPPPFHAPPPPPPPGTAPGLPPMAIPVGYATTGSYESYLAPSEGLLIRERFFWSQVMCGACERKTQFKMAQWNSSMPDRIDDTFFQAQRAMGEIREESECCMRYCCHQFRELKLGMFSPAAADPQSMGYSDTGWPTNEQPMLVMDRPFKCPIILCCFMPCPPEMSVSSPSGHIGRAVFEWKWWNCCWPCDQHMNLFDAQGQHVYKVHTPALCGGCCSIDGQNRCCTNCCAPTCCAPTFTATVHDAQTGFQVASWENQWPGCNMRGLCQADSAASNYVLKFGDATPQQKALIMTGMFLANFLYFEKRANQK